MTQSIAVTDSHLFWAPYVWYGDGGGALAANNLFGSSTYALTNCLGAYLKFGVTTPASGTVILNLNTANLSGVTAGGCPTIAVSVDGGPYTAVLTVLGGGTQSITLASGLAAGTHQFDVLYKSVGAIDDYWVTPKLSVKVTGLTIDDSASMVSPPIFSTGAIFFGDSHFAGFDTVGAALANADNDALLAAPRILGRACGFEYGAIAFAGQGYGRGIGNVAASSSAPSMKNATANQESWDKYWSGHSRLVSGLFSPEPAHIFIGQGQNDSGLAASLVTSSVDAFRTAAGTNCRIWAVKNACGANGNGSAIQTGVGNAADTAKSKEIVSGITQLVTVGTAGAYTNDASHPSLVGQKSWANQIKSIMSATYSVTPSGRPTRGSSPSYSTRHLYAAPLTALTRHGFVPVPNGGLTIGTLTISAPHPLMIVLIVEYGENQHVTGVTQNGVALTKVATVGVGSDLNSNGQKGTVWYLANPASGAFVITGDGSAQNFAYHANVCQMAAQSAPTVETHTATGYSPSVSFTGADLAVVDLLAVTGDPVTDTTAPAQTRAWQVADTSGLGRSYGSLLLGSSPTVGWTVDPDLVDTHVYLATAVGAY